MGISKIAADRNRRGASADCGNAAVATVLDPGIFLVFEINIGFKTMVRPPGQRWRDKEMLDTDEVAKRVVIFIGEVNAIQETAITQYRAGCVDRGAVQVVGAKLLLYRILRCVQRTFGHQVYQPTGFDSAKQDGGRPFQYFDTVEIGGFQVRDE